MNSKNSGLHGMKSLFEGAILIKGTVIEIAPHLVSEVTCSLTSLQVMCRGELPELFSCIDQEPHDVSDERLRYFGAVRSRQVTPVECGWATPARSLSPYFHLFYNVHRVLF